MADELMVEIATPEKMVFSDKVEEVTIPGVDGEFGVLFGHAPLLTLVNIGELDYTRDNKKIHYAIGAGYVEVTFQKVTLLLDSAERSDEIDKESAKKEKDAAEAELSKMNKEEDKGYKGAKDKLSLAEARLKVAEKA